ncbi:enhancer of mRNA-decapping protein 4 isoform X1 [Leuresthes tenuis]|uniref:enhancer of mRNA-decapping protein 4 isoform X1 n=1 Tax=Leuresthes tenuis TaxID=355514 RepID=UPI003B5058BD
MASNSNIDIEGATQHLRDILKLDRPGSSADAQSSDAQRKPSFNGELNGLLGAGLLGTTDRSNMSDSTRPISTDLSAAEEKQTICLTGDDGSTCIPITSSSVEVVASQDSSINSKARGSSKVKIQPVAKYDWEHKYYYGRLIAVSNSFLAYAIRGANNHAMVRVLSLDFNERSLLKGFTGAVTDLAFAHIDSSLLGCVDEAGNLMVWQLTCTGSKILDQIVVHIQRPEDTPLNSHRRLIWSPVILDDNEDNQDDTSQTLALLHEDRAEVLEFEFLRANISSWPVDATELKEGLITVKGHTGRVSEGVLSPDGTVLTTASHDGYIKFWQIYMDAGQDKPRCLHELQPHGGRPLSCLLFCDNHKRQDPEVPFWRFLITGADQNQELKMWCTVTWNCLQTIRFSPDPFNSSTLPSLKASLDLSAEYLILTDVQRKVLYVMELRQDHEKGKASFTAVSEFLLTHPVLSFGVRDVTHSRLRHTEVLPAEEESESLTTEGTPGPTESKSGIQIKLYCVHTKSLQDVQIWFQPNSESNVGSNSAGFLPHSDSQDGFAGFSDHLTDQSSDKESGSGSQTDLRKIPSLPAPSDFLSNSGASSGPMPKLMTPDAFMTPTSTSVPASPGSSASSLTIITAISSNSDSTNRAMDDVSQSPSRADNSGSSLGLSTSTSSPRAASAVLLPGLDNVPVLTSPSGPLALDSSQILDSPLLPPLASPTRARSPDVISSASTAMSQDMPEIASQTLQLQRSLVPSLEALPLSALQTDSMASAASALHLLTSPRTVNNNSLLPLELGGGEGPGGGAAESEPRLSNTPSLLENALSQENPGAGGGSSDGNVSHTPWPAAPDITRETRNSLRDNGLGDCSREESKDRHLSSPYHRRSFHLTQNDSPEGGAEQSDPDDEVASLGSSSGNCGSRSSHRMPVKDWKTSPRGSPKLKRKLKKDDGESSQSRQMDSAQFNAETQDELLMLLRTQQRELTELWGLVETMPSAVMAQLEHVLMKHQEQEHRRLERVLSESQNHQQQLQEQLSQQLSHTLGSALTSRMDKVLREELKKTVPQTISKSLEPVTGHLNNTIAAKLTAVEVTLKDNVGKVVKSKNTTDAIGRAAAEAMQGPIQAAYKDAFQSIVLPVFERGCQSMFQQINDSFKQGTQEYIQQLETHMKSRKQREQETRDPMVGQLQQMIDSFQSSTDQLSNNITASVRAEVQHQMQMMVGNLQESILSHVQRIVKGEVSLAMKEQQAVVTSSIMQAMRSAAGTPVPTAHLDYQTQQANILQLLQQGQLNQAFQQALSATDLNLVLYVCETIDSQQVFGQHPCPLSQPVLLSLIQQLSSNLTTRSELKISYLEDAVMNLDHSDPLTRDHMASVLAQVRPKLIAFLQQDPHSPLSKRARRLVMMLQGIFNH